MKKMYRLTIFAKQNKEESRKMSLVRISRSRYLLSRIVVIIIAAHKIMQ
jgi:hypothetical protein